MPADGLARLGAALANSVSGRLDGILAAEFPTDSPLFLGRDPARDCLGSRTTDAEHDGC